MVLVRVAPRGLAGHQRLDGGWSIGRRPTSAARRKAHPCAECELARVELRVVRRAQLEKLLPAEGQRQRLWRRAGRVAHSREWNHRTAAVLRLLCCCCVLDQSLPFFDNFFDRLLITNVVFVSHWAVGFVDDVDVVRPRSRMHGSAQEPAAVERERCEQQERQRTRLEGATALFSAWRVGSRAQRGLRRGHDSSCRFAFAMRSLAAASL